MWAAARSRYLGDGLGARCSIGSAVSKEAASCRYVARVGGGFCAVVVIKVNRYLQNHISKGSLNVNKGSLLIFVSSRLPLFWLLL